MSERVRYRTIVADPPWEYEGGCVAAGPGHGLLRASQPLPYPSMTFAEIIAIPVESMAASDSRLFLWTTNRWLRSAFNVMTHWGFKYKQTLVWHKTDTNLVGSVAPNSVEFVLVGVRGKPERLSWMPSAVVAAPHGRQHSQKPEAWMDHFEAISPGPYLELFARRQRLGWDTWGNEALNHLEMTA